METICETITAQAAEGLFINEWIKVDVTATPSTEVLIACALQQVNQQGANGKAQIAITAYVQNGETHEGSWPILKANNITSVTTTLSVSSARATASVLIITNP
jgi:hypothetical protein